MDNYTEIDAQISMRDNATLYTRIFFSSKGHEGRRLLGADRPKVSAIYIQCPYGLDYHQIFIEQWAAFAYRGLKQALIIQETRARYNSTGSFDFSRLAVDDAADTVAWLTAQKWSNGNVIPYGISAMGTKALLAGNLSYVPHTQNLGLFSNGLHSAAFRGGVYRSTIVVGMLNFTNQSNLEPEITAHEGDDAWWRPAEFAAWSAVDWPTVFNAGWFDIFQKDTMQACREPRASNPSQTHPEPEIASPEAWWSQAFERYRAQSPAHVRHFHKPVVDPLGHCGLHAFEGDLNATAIALVKEAEQVLNMVLFDAFSLAEVAAPRSAR